MTEGKELSGQFGSALACFLDFGQVVIQRIVLLEVVKVQIAVAIDHNKKTIKIVGDPPPARAGPRLPSSEPGATVLPAQPARSLEGPSDSAQSSKRTDGGINSHPAGLTQRSPKPFKSST